MKAAVRSAALVIVAASALVAAQETPKQDKTVYLNEQQSFTPGYPIGDIALGDPAVADFKVLPGRRELLLFGKTAGKTTLTIWDQRGVKRHEILIAVVDRKLGETEKELRDLLKDYPGLEVHTLAGQLAITGTVTTETDRDAIEKIAGASGAQNLVRYNPPPRQTVIGGSGMPTPTGSAPIAPVAAGSTSGTDAPAAAPAGSALSVEYELEVLEASVQFGSGSYATGVEPSGRSLFKQKVRIPVDSETEVVVPGQALMPKETQKNQPKNAGKSAAPAPTEPIALRLKLRPGPPDEDGRFPTFLLIETNLPTGEGSAKDPSIVRRARWQFTAQSGEPVGIAGAELLAVADTSSGPSKLSRSASAGSFWSSLPGISSIKGAEYGGQIPYYDKQHKTQLLLVVHPRLVQGR